MSDGAARPRDRDELPRDDVPRSSPMTAQLVLLGGFLALLVVGVLTVFLPEIRDDADPEDGEDGAAAVDAPDPAEAAGPAAAAAP
jgi:hypothetical protein